MPLIRLDKRSGHTYAHYLVRKYPPTQAKVWACKFIWILIGCQCFYGSSNRSESDRDAIVIDIALPWH